MRVVLSKVAAVTCRTERTTGWQPPGTQASDPRLKHGLLPGCAVDLVICLAGGGERLSDQRGSEASFNLEATNFTFC